MVQIISMMKAKTRNYQRGNINITKISIRGFPKEIFPCEGKGNRPWKLIQIQLKRERDRLYQEAVDLFEQYKHQHEQITPQLEPSSPTPQVLDFDEPVEHQAAFDPVPEFHHGWFGDDPDLNTF
jgi:hypothetical protein